MGRRRRGGGRRKRRSGGKRTLKGGLLKGRQHPTTTSSSPWNSLTLTNVWTGKEAGITCFIMQQLQIALRGELGLDPKQAVDIRVLRIDIWVPPTSTATVRNYIVFSPSDWSNKAICGSWSQMNWYESWGTVAEPAHLHYVWPKSMTIMTQPYENTAAVLFRMDVKANQQYIMKHHVLWRPSNPDPLPTDVLTGDFVSMHDHRHKRPAQGCSSEVDTTPAESCAGSFVVEELE